MKRDFKDVGRGRTMYTGAGKMRGWEKRPVYDGPVPDRYYYVVKNKKRSPDGPYVGLYTDDPRFEGKVRTILVNGIGTVSIMESDVPLPTGPNCKLKRHSKIERVIEILKKSGLKINEGPNEEHKHPWTTEDELEVFE